MTEMMRPTYVPLEKVRWMLTWVWFAGSALMMLILLIQTFTGRYGSMQEATKGWGWLFSMVLPTLALFIAILGATAHEPVGMMIKRSFYRFVLCLSLGYFVVLVISYVLLSVVSIPVERVPLPASGAALDVEPFTRTIEMRLADKLPLSMAWLGPLQGLVTAALGYMFFKREPTMPTTETRLSAPDPASSPSPPGDISRRGSTEHGEIT